jgi:predicted ATPase/DNA-binding XRE family transcriptional regulator
MGEPPNQRSSAGKPSAGGSFGELLKSLRFAARLTQGELAERSGVSRGTISDLERGTRRTPQGESARMLADALGLAGETRAGFLRVVREQRAPRRRAAVVPVALPVSDVPMVGREAELEAAAAALAAGTRLITLAGPGGVGKSRLALEIAAQAAEDAQRIVVWVALDAVEEPSRLMATIAGACGVPERLDVPAARRVIDALSGQRVVIVLDTMERLLPAAAELDELLAALPDLVLVATSRELLRLPAERAIAIEPLPVPSHRDGRAALAANPGVALFLRWAAPEAGGDDDASLVENAARVVRLVDGLPLAIELAAAQARLLPAAAVADLLEQAGLEALAHGPRGSTRRFLSMEDAIAWSVDLLPDHARRLLPVLGVFRDGFTVEAIAGIGRALRDRSLVAGLPALVNGHLVRQSHGRYTMLEPIRLYAAGRLETSGQETPVRNAHAIWFRDWTWERGEEIQGANPGPALAAIDREFANVRQAASWAAGHGDPASAVTIAAGLGSWLEVRGRYAEGRELMDEALAAADLRVPGDRLATALFWSGQAASMQGDIPVTLGRANQLRALADTGGPGADAADLRALALLLESAVAELHPSTAGDAARYLLEAHATLPAGTATFTRWAICLRLGVELAMNGESAEALPLLEEALAIAEVRDRLIEKPVPLIQHGFALLELGRADEAAPELAAGVAIASRLGLDVAATLAMLCIAGLLSAADSPEGWLAAARTLGAAEASCARNGIKLGVFWDDRVLLTKSRLRERLGGAKLGEMLGVGAELTLLEAGAKAQVDALGQQRIA